MGNKFKKGIFKKFFGITLITREQFNNLVKKANEIFDEADLDKNDALDFYEVVEYGKETKNK